MKYLGSHLHIEILPTFTTKHARIRLNSEAVGFFSSSFDHIRSKDNISSNRNLALSIDLAMIEHEEQRKMRILSMIPLVNAAHPKALSIFDMNAICPLIAPPVVDSERKCENNSKMSINKFYHYIHPKVCPQFERGLDRMWLMDAMNLSGIEKTLDTMESLQCEIVSSVPLAMAQLKEVDQVRYA
uniref:Uncharacterized protein n=1 Tax=Proboscia inermis TaxID=420281 RepID=A0A7S0CJZ9_9STRA|mmetsp:Transcript_53400/g.53807  ORF Transcript_53400/g.53807 Transcript_53400/m.53807 type:complete len:185 (+) Transcript_53400:723-1277(+)|eukprot:CAMPEP_0171301980 /NCGR_PEP_ID=MMETSP0816-20121228/11258_1 /TAXON_ID=420281 /ORGANISM="Proboscia inermis, Strain CCAP1064/1" /LENGTH=184 /DNA_ID=CAMNT_0011780013 /DNA_START=85 /DNA_END=639 /DNA_ORIENTATION=+